MATQAYFTIPKALETDPRYASLSLGARYLYVHLRDTFKLSIKNNWRDSLGVYIKIARETMAKFLGVSLPTVRKYIKELRRAGLIFDLRMGLTKCNRIYIRLLDGETENDLLPRQKESVPSAEKQGFTPDRNASPTNNRSLNMRNPNDDKKYRWILKNGDKWFEGDMLMWLNDGDIEPYPTRKYLRGLFEEALPGF